MGVLSRKTDGKADLLLSAARAARVEIRKRPNFVLFDVLSAMDQEARYLLEQAERCRRIADRISDAETAALFQVMAEEYEAKAVSLAKDHESSSKVK
jgi:hypothetical protein